MKNPFRGRVRPPKIQELSTALPCRRLAFVYQRLSTTEQKKNSIYSLERQDDLARLAREDGYPVELIYVERRDLGISGTLGQESRPGLAYLIEQIELDRVESLYVIELSRISRDQTLLNGYQFGELCKEHGVIIVTPAIRLNLCDELHMRMYRYMLDHAAEELKTLRFRFQSAKEMKARHGYYTSGSMPPGYILDSRNELQNGSLNPNAQKLVPYEPHARVIRLLFQELAKPNTTLKSVALWSQTEQIVFAPFPEELARVKVNTLSFARSRCRGDGSYPITTSRLGSIAHNPAYIGWFIWGGQVLARDNHAPIVDEKIFWQVQEKFSRQASPQTHAPRPLLLSNLLVCGMHQPARRIISSNNKNKEQSFYRCVDENEARGCLYLNARVLDEPIQKLVHLQCSFDGYANRVIASLMAEQEQTRVRIEAMQREYVRLEKQIQILKTNLAETRIPEQVDAFLQQVEFNMQKKAELAAIGNHPLGRVLSAAEAQTIRDFLSNLETHWRLLTTELKNNLLAVLLDRVAVRQDSKNVTALVVWRTGLRQEIRIPSDQLVKVRRWTMQENQFLRDNYDLLPPHELCQKLSGRAWQSIQRQASKLGLTNSESKQHTRRDTRPFTADEDETLRTAFSDSLTETELFARLAHRSLCTIQYRARQLRLLKKRALEWEYVTLDWKNPYAESAEQDISTTSEHSPKTLDTVRDLAQFIQSIET